MTEVIIFGTILILSAAGVMVAGIITKFRR